MAQRTRPKQTCTYHCATCGAHFHALRAFDDHNPGKGTCDTGAVSEKTDKPLLEKWTDEGYCHLDDSVKRDDPAMHPVTIWTQAGLSRRREQLAHVHGREAARKGKG